MCLKTRPSRIPWAILVAMLVGMAASTASANAFTSLLIGEVPGSGIPGIQTLCDGDCSTLPETLPTRSGLTFDFEYGIRPNLGGFDLAVESAANIFILGPVRAVDSIRFFAQSGIELHGSGQIDAGGDVEFDTGPESPILVPPIYAPPIVPGPGGFDSICGCIPIGDGTRIEMVTDESLRIWEPGVTIADDGLLLIANTDAAGLFGAMESVTLPGLSISRDGDIYLDLSLVTLNSVYVKSGKWIVLADMASMPVIPEPGTAVLLGLGLVGLANERRGSAN